MTVTTKPLSDTEVNKLWEAFKVFDQDGSGGISADELGQVMISLGQSPNELELREMIKEVDIDSSGTIDFEEFKALMVSYQGDRQSRLKLAFSVFDQDGSGQITADELRSVMSQFGLTDQELDDIIKEVDHDGDASIDFDEFCKLVPEETSSTGYKDVPIVPSANVVENSATVTETPVQTSTDEVTELKALLAKHPQQETRKGTSLLQMQIGLFRLIQGAAYRCFRESYSANHETHLRVRNLPYRMPDFVKFVNTAIALYKGLGIVENACFPVLDAVVESITAEYQRLQEQIKNWETIPKTPEMLAESQAMIANRKKSTTVKEKFAAGVEFAITLKKKHFNLKDVAEGILAINELNRLRQLELSEEFAPISHKIEGDAKEYLKKWNKVIINDADDAIDGAMISTAYWYEDFMPKLLAAFNVSKSSDIASNTNPDVNALDQWYAEVKASGQLNQFGLDVLEGFPNCTPKQKLEIKQAWRLTNTYLNGVQKKRERAEFGRDSGELSNYISFIDVYLGRSAVKNAEMRVSFPYFIGPAVWRFFHTTAEIVDSKPLDMQKPLIPVFKDFFKLFATMYPCPYCRHHLNAYVVRNREVDMYPMEYLVLGRDPNLEDFQVLLDAKLSTVVDGATLRLFFWKLHNTVSSSIARTEPWYHKDEKAFYTTRYWPSLDSELARSKALGHLSIASDRIYRLYGMLKPESKLAGLRANLQKLFAKGDKEGIRETTILADSVIKELEETVLSGNFLQETYGFNPDLDDSAPYFTPEEEEFARSGLFVETT
jgi:Ca2+-binding EF-hand superfamily protein